MRLAVAVVAFAVAFIASAPGGLGPITPVRAQDMSSSFEQVPLTPKDVENFLASYPALQSLSKQLEARYGAPQTTDEEDPAGAFAGYLQNDKARAEIEGVLKRYGFPNFDAWSRVTNSVVIAYGAVSGGETASGSDNDSLDKEIEDIRKDPKLTDEQKDAKIAELTEQLGALDTFRPLSGNVDVVRPFAARLKTLLEAE